MKRGTPDHPKTFELAELLGVTWLEALGVLELLFHITSRYAPQGNIGKWSDEIICQHFRDRRWTRHPDKLINALVESGWLDRDPDYRLIVHDWEEHADQSTRKTLKSRGEDFVRPSRNHVVYFIEAPHSKLIKIGVTGRKVEAVFSELQAKFSEKLRLIGTVSGGIEIENRLHERHNHLKTDDNWLIFSNDLLNEINELCDITPETIQYLSWNDSNSPRARSLSFPKPKPEPIVEECPVSVASGPILDAPTADDEIPFENANSKPPNSPLATASEYLQNARRPRKTQTAGQSDIERIRENLVAYVGGANSELVGKWGLPDDEICQRCLTVCDPASVELVEQALIELFRQDKRPGTSWGWFPVALGNYLTPKTLAHV